MPWRSAARLVVYAVLLGVMCPAADAAADVVTFTTGTRIQVDGVRLDGDVAILTLPGGQEIRTARVLLAGIAPDPSAWTRAAALAARATSPAAAAARLSRGALRAVVERVARRLELDPRLAHAIVQLESNYDPLAVSARGAMGLMQIMPDVARTYAARDPYDPEQNLEAGLRHLRRLIERFDMRRALAAYNAGEGAVSRHGGVPPYPETQAYVRRILASIQPSTAGSGSTASLR